MEDNKVQTEISDAQYRNAAKRRYSWHSDGDVDIDENAVVSRGDEPGAYVQAWVWVRDEDIK